MPSMNLDDNSKSFISCLICFLAFNLSIPVMITVGVVMEIDLLLSLPFILIYFFINACSAICILYGDRRQEDESCSLLYRLLCPISLGWLTYLIVLSGEEGIVNEGGELPTSRFWMIISWICYSIVFLVAIYNWTEYRKVHNRNYTHIPLLHTLPEPVYIVTVINIQQDKGGFS
jgi:hypothetical protein